MKPYQISTWAACTFDRSRASLAEYDVEVTICSHSLKVCRSSPILGREVADRIRDINVGIAGRASRWHCRDRRWPSGRSRMGGAAAISVAMLGSASAAAALAGRSTQQLCNPCVYVHICGQAYHRPIGSFCLRGHALHRGQSSRVIRSRIRERRGEPIKSFASESTSLLTQRVSFQHLIGAAASSLSCNIL